MEFDIPIRVTAFLYDLEKKLILFVGALYTYLTYMGSGLAITQ